MERLAAIVLAAGRSTRMGGFKPLLELDGRPLLEWALGSFVAVGIADVIVVTGHRGDEVAALARRLGVRTVPNPGYDRGMYSSVQAGVAALPADVARFFVLPLDVPLVRPETVGQLARRAAATEADVVYPVRGGATGHPPLVAAILRAEILAAEPDGGLRALLHGHADDSLPVEVDDDGILIDTDTADDLARARAVAREEGLPDEERCEVLLRERCSPTVTAHVRAVAELALSIAAELQRKGGYLCLPLLAAAALLHDVCRREPRHAEAGAALLETLGYRRVARVARGHMDLAPELADDLGETQILYLADKMVRGIEVVGLEARFLERLEKLGDDVAGVSAARARMRVAAAVRAHAMRRAPGAVPDPLAMSVAGLEKLMAPAGEPADAPPAAPGPDLLAADLDGTLIAAAGEPAPSAAAALREVAAAGAGIVICTGRPTESALRVVRRLGVTSGHLISYGGAETRDLATGDVLESVTLPADAVQRIRDAAVTEALHVDEHGSPHGTTRLVLTGREPDVERAVRALLESCGEESAILRPAAGVAAVQSRLATKTGALERLAGRLGIAREAVVYVGDAADDAGALRWAGLGITVGEQSAEAAAAGDVLTPQCLVAQLLLRLALARSLRPPV